MISDTHLYRHPRVYEFRKVEIKHPLCFYDGTKKRGVWIQPFWIQDLVPPNADEIKQVEFIDPSLQLK